MTGLTLMQPWPWCIARGIATVIPIGETLAAEWRARVEKRRVAIRSSASGIDHAVLVAMKQRMPSADFDAFWRDVLEAPLGAVIGTALAGCPFVGDEVNQRAALVSVPKGTSCASLTEFEALGKPCFVDGPDVHLSLSEWTSVGMIGSAAASDAERQTTLF